MTLDYSNVEPNGRDADLPRSKDGIDGYVPRPGKVQAPQQCGTQGMLQGEALTSRPATGQGCDVRYEAASVTKRAPGEKPGFHTTASPERSQRAFRFQSDFCLQNSDTKLR